MLDLSKTNPAKAAEIGYTFNVTLPDGTVTDAKITVRGSNSATVKNYYRRMFQEMKMKEQQAKRRGREVEEPTLDELEEQASEAAAMRIISWEGIATEGKAVPFTQEAAVKIMKEHDWLRNQVVEHSDNVFNFRLD